MVGFGIGFTWCAAVLEILHLPGWMPRGTRSYKCQFTQNACLRAEVMLRSGGHVEKGDLRRDQRLRPPQRW
jgi:hypothetical protein